MRSLKHRQRARILAMGMLSGIMVTVLTGAKKEEDSFQKPDVENTVSGIADIEKLTFGEEWSSVPEISEFSLTRKPEGSLVRLEIMYEDEYVKMEEEAVLDQAREILEKYDVSSWDGFHGSNSMVLDGGSFHMTVELVDGTSITASGNNSFPSDYHAVASELKELIEPTRKSWYDEQHPKVIEDTQIEMFSLRVYPKIGSEKFECRFEERSDDPGKVYMNVWICDGYKIPDSDCTEYFFYGAVPNPPFEKIQEIVEKYNLAAWNGYDEFLPYEEKEQTFYLDIGYESGESISANGSLLPENYEEAETEMVRVIWDYIQEYQDEFVPWQ